MKTARIVELMDETKNLLGRIAIDYSQTPMTEKRIEISADVIALLDLIKDVKVEMRDSLERKIEALQGAMEDL